jgi:type II secretion system protein N
VKKFLKYILYFLYALLLFLLIVIYKFPYNDVKSYAIKAIENSYPVNVVIDKVSYSFPLNFNLENVDIKDKESKKSLLKLDKIRLSANPMALLSNHQSINYFIQTPYKSRLNGSVVFDKSSNTINSFELYLIKLQMDKLKQYLGKSFMFFDLSGLANGKIDFEGNISRLSDSYGTLNLRIKGINFALKIPFSKFKDLKDISINGIFKLKNNNLSISGKIKQKYLKSDINGSIKINNRDLSRSRIDMKIELKVDPYVIDKRLMPKKMLNKIMRGQKIVIKISRNLQNPAINF